MLADVKRNEEFQILFHRNNPASVYRHRFRARGEYGTQRK